MIEIHEFSTGIQYERTSDGGWRSRGFTGEFINRTLDAIPQAIEKAIIDKEFAIAEGTVADSPALVGREVTLDEQVWSVLAVVTLVLDEKKRGFPAYRYFYTRGKGNLEQLVRWWTAEKYPVFNPLEPAFVRLYETQDNIDVPLDNFQDLLEGTAPIIVPNVQPLPPLIVHAIAQKLAGENDIAWAWNVGGLEYPKSFHAIYPDTPQAAQLISQIISSQSSSTGIIRGTHGIKVAIQNLMNQDTIKTEYLETLETALSNPQIDEKLWKSYFDAKGANQAISQQMYSPNMVRLLTLRSLILPNTLPEFLGWLQARSQEKEHYETSVNFQQEIIKKLSKKAPRLADKIMDGVKLIIPYLLEKPELLEPTIWLLGSTTGIWANLYFHEVKKKIEHDLSLMSDLARGKKQTKNNFSLWDENKEGVKQIKDDLPLTLGMFKDTKDTDFNLVPEWEPIWQQIKGFWLSDKIRPISQYLPLAKLFDQLGEYKVSAVFYQIATGSVPNLVFKQVTQNSYTCTLFKLKVEKYVSKLELIWLALIKFGGKIMPVAFVIPLVLIFSILGGVAGYFGRPIIEGKIKPVTSSSRTPNPSDSKITISSSLNNQTLAEAGLDINKAEKNSPKTYDMLKKLIKSDNTTKKENLVNILNQTLDNKNKYSDLKKIKLNTNDLDLSDFGGDKKIQQNWIKAIFLYQKDNKLTPDGTISNEGETFKKLKAEIDKKLSLPK